MEMAEIQIVFKHNSNCRERNFRENLEKSVPGAAQDGDPGRTVTIYRLALVSPFRDQRRG